MNEINYIMENDIKQGGEYQLTTALENLRQKGAKFSQKLLGTINYSTIAVSKWTNDNKINNCVAEIIKNYLIEERELMAKMIREKFDATIGSELPNGIVQMAKVYVANKRKLKVGDKMAGRHGNKGIVAKVVRAEDMPFLKTEPRLI